MRKQECPKGDRLVDLHIKIPSKLKKKLRKKAYKEDRTVADIVVEIISKWFEKEAQNLFKDVEPEEIKWEEIDFSFPPKK